MKCDKRHNLRHKIKHKLALLLATALLTACSFQFPGSTDPLLKIGLVAPFEGQFRARGYEVLYAVRLAVRQWNKAGGVEGYRVELVALDDGGDPTMAMQQVRELAVDQDVMGVIGHFVKETTLAAAPEYATQGLTLVAPDAGTEAITAAGWVVRLGPSNRLLGSEAARYAVENLSAARLAVLRDEDDQPTDHMHQDLADAFVAAARRLGSPVVLDKSIVENGWLSHLTDVSPDLIFLSCNAIKGAEAIRLARQAGVEATFLGGPALDDRALVQIGSASVEGTVYLAVAPAGLDLAGSEAFVADYQALAGHPPGSRATLAYEATHFLLQAIARAVARSPRQLSRATVWQQLAEVCQYEGLLGTLICDDAGKMVNWPIAIYRIEASNYPGQRLR